MAEEAKIGLDNAAFRGRLRQIPERARDQSQTQALPGMVDGMSYRLEVPLSTAQSTSQSPSAVKSADQQRRHVAIPQVTKHGKPERKPSPEFKIENQHPAAPDEVPAVSVVKPQPYAEPALPRLQSSRVLRRQLHLDRPRSRQRGKKHRKYAFAYRQPGSEQR